MGRIAGAFDELHGDRTDRKRGNVSMDVVGTLLSGAAGALLTLWIENYFIRKPTIKKRKRLLLRMIVFHLKRAMSELEFRKKNVMDYERPLAMFPWDYFAVPEAWKILQSELTEELDDETIDTLSLVFSKMDIFQMVFKTPMNYEDEELKSKLSNAIDKTQSFIQTAIDKLDEAAGFPPEVKRGFN